MTQKRKVSGPTTGHLPLDRLEALRPVEQVDTYLVVRSRLEQLIAQYQPGDRLPSERSVAEQLQVSRAVVREALKVLQFMGKVEISRGAGVFVLKPEPDPVAQRLLAANRVDRRFLVALAESRVSLEVRIVELAAEAVERSGWGEVGAILAADAEGLDEDGERDSLNLLFEAAIARSLGNPVLIALQASLHEVWVEAWDRLGLSPGNRGRLHAEHLAIFDALVARDRELAAGLMRRHVAGALDAAVDDDGEGRRR